jgi:hypothetical protein
MADPAPNPSEPQPFEPPLPGSGGADGPCRDAPRSSQNENAERPRPDQPLPSDTSAAGEKWAVVVVHGVGVGGPGTTLDSLVNYGLTLNELQNIPEQLGPQLTPEIRLFEEEPNPWHPHRGPRFPMHLRRFQATDKVPEVVFAEAYWADLTATQHGLWPLLVRVFTIIFDMSLLSDAAAWSRDGTGPRPRPLPAFQKLRKWMYCVSWILCGPIAGLNGFLLLMLVANFGIGLISEVGVKVTQAPKATSVVAGLSLGFVLFGFGFWVLHASRERAEEKSLARAFLSTSALAIVCAGLGYLAAGAVDSLLLWVDWRGPESGDDSGTLARLAKLWSWFGAGLAALCGCLLAIGQRRNWQGSRQLLLAVGLAIGLGVFAAFFAFASVAQHDRVHFQEAAMIGYGIGGACLAGLLVARGRRWRNIHGRDVATIHVVKPATPIAAGDSLTVANNQVLQLTANDLLRDAEVAQGEPGSVVAPLEGTGPAHGTLTSRGTGTWTYTPEPGSVDPVEFQFSFLYRIRRWSSAWILLYRTVLVVGLLVAAMALCRVWRAPSAYEAGVCGRFIRKVMELKTDPFDTFESYLAALMFLIHFCYVAISVPLVGMLFWSWRCRRLARGARPRSTAEPATTLARMEPAVWAAVCATLLQLGLWVLVVPAFGLLALNRFAPEQIAPGHTLFDAVWRAFAVHMLFMGGLSASLIALWLWRAIWSGEHRASNPVPPPGVPRLIVHRRYVVAPLLTFSLLGMAAFVLSFVGALNRQLDIHWLRWLETGPIHQWLDSWSQGVIGVAAATIAVLYFVFGEGIRNGLHIISDVIGHFYRSSQLSPRKPPPRLIRLRDYPTERRIEARVIRVLEHVFEAEMPTRVIVLAHSQGSVAAFHALWFRLNDPQDEPKKTVLSLLKRLKQPKVDLVTFGSPLTHLYQEYFPYRYHPLFIGDKCNWGNFTDHVARWHNVFRIDDFVGTYVDGDARKQFVENVEIHEGGHTDYWKDHEFLRVLLSRRLLPGRR